MQGALGIRCGLPIRLAIVGMNEKVKALRANVPGDLGASMTDDVALELLSRKYAAEALARSSQTWLSITERCGKGTSGMHSAGI